MSRTDSLERPARLPLPLVLACVLASLLLLGGGALALLLRHPSVFDGALYLISGAVVVAAYIGLLALYNRYARWAAVQHDKAIHLAHAQRALPAGVQSVAWHDSSRPALPPPAASEVIDVSLAAAPTTIPTFAQLLDQGRVGPGQPLILGFDAATSEAITGDWNSLYSCGIGALQGAGKTWLAAFLLAQSAAQGGRMIVCDLDAGDPESLATRIAALSPAYMCDVASTPEAILSAWKLAHDKMQRRATDVAARWPIIIACDEWTSLLGGPHGDEIAEIAVRIGQHGRKFNVNAVLCAQGWTLDTAGRIRNRLTSHYVMRQRPDEARYQLGLYARQIPLDIPFLPDATAYLFRPRVAGLPRVVIPQMTTADLVRVGALIEREAAVAGRPFGLMPASRPLPVMTAETPGKPEGSAPAEAASTPAQSRQTVSGEALRAAALFRQNMSEKAIVKELRGVEGGRNYDAAREEVRRLIVEGLRHDVS